MFIVKPLARNRPNPVPFAFSDINASHRYITTKSINYNVNDSKVLYVRLNSNQEKNITLPAGTNGRVLIIQDIGGNSVENPCRLICPDFTFNDHTTEKLFTDGPFTIALRFNDGTYDIVEQRNEWSIDFLLLGEQPNILPDREVDSVVDSVDGDLLLLMGNPTNREVVVHIPSLPDGSSTYPEQFFTVMDTTGTGSAYPIRVRFDQTTMNGNSEFIMTGNNAWITFRSLPDGTYQYMGSNGATFSGYDVPFNVKTFGFVSVDAPYYGYVQRGFASVAGATGGKFMTTGV